MIAPGLRNERTGGLVATSVERATTRAERKRGLLGRDGLEPSSALWLEPCLAVHTAFMRFAIDIVFIDKQGRAVKIVENVPPWRIAVAVRAHAVIEMAAGSLRGCGVAIGDRLYVATSST